MQSGVSLSCSFSFISMLDSYAGSHPCVTSLPCPKTLFGGLLNHSFLGHILHFHLSSVSGHLDVVTLETLLDSSLETKVDDPGHIDDTGNDADCEENQ